VPTHGADCLAIAISKSLAESAALELTEPEAIAGSVHLQVVVIVRNPFGCEGEACRALTSWNVEAEEVRDLLRRILDSGELPT